MPNQLPSNPSLVSIREAADSLGVSLKTLRRWEGHGLVHPVRNDQNQRVYSAIEIANLDNRKYKPLPENSIAPQNQLSISQAADELGVSIKTLRRWDAEGKIQPLRDDLNRRIFTPEQIATIKANRSQFSQSPNSQLTQDTQPIIVARPLPSRSFPAFAAPLLSLLPFILVAAPILVFSLLGYKPSVPLQSVSFNPATVQPLNPDSSASTNTTYPTASSSAYSDTDTNPILRRIRSEGEVAGLTVTGGSFLSFENVLDDNYNFGVAGTIEGNQIISSTTVKAPFVVGSQEKVTNLNADLLDGHSWEEVESVVVEPNSLQKSYEAGNTITTTDKNLDITLSGGTALAIGGTGAVNFNTSGQTTFTGNVRAGSGLTVIGNLTLNSVPSGSDSRLLTVNSSSGLVSYVDTASWDKSTTDDLSASTSYAGDVSGLYNNLQLGSGVVGSTEISDASVAEVDLSISNAPVNGYFLQTNGSGTLSWSNSLNLGSLSLNGSIINATATELNLLSGHTNVLLDSASISATVQAYNANTSLLGQTIDGTEFRLGSDTAGDLIYFNGTNWARLAGSGTDGFALKYNTATNVPYWAADAGGTSYTASNGVTLVGADFQLDFTTFETWDQNLWDDLTFDNLSTAAASLLATWDMNASDDVTAASVGATVQAYNANTSLLGQTIEEGELNITNGPSNGYFLQTDGSGALTWVDISGMVGGSGDSYLSLTAEQLHPTNIALDFLLGGTSTAAATIALQSNTGNIKATSADISSIRISSTTVGLTSDPDLLSMSSSALTVNGTLDVISSITAPTIGTINNLNINNGAVSNASSLALQLAGNTWDSSGNLAVSNDLTATHLYTRDTNQSNTLQLRWNEDDTANRILDFYLAGANRQLTLNENFTIGDGAGGILTYTNAATLTVEGNANLNQDLTTDASPTFAGLTLSTLSAIANNRLLNINSSTGVISYIDSTTWDMNYTDDVTAASVGATVQAYNADTSLLGQSISESELDISNGPSLGYVLQTDGSGVLSWVDLGLSASNYWLQTGEQLYAKNALVMDLLIGGDSTASATIALQANTGTITAGNILPKTNDAFDLGSDSYRFKDLYLGGETLHLGTSTTDEGTISYSSSNILSFDTDSTTNGDIAFFTDDLYLDKSTGRVGIGITNPTALLDVGGNFSVNTTGNISKIGGVGSANLSSSFLSLYNNGGTAGISNAAPGNSNFSISSGTGSGSYIFFNTANTERVRINGSGNVGIGTTNPASKLHVSGGYGGNAAVTFDQTLGGDIFTASASGTTRLTLANNGDLDLISGTYRLAGADVGQYFIDSAGSTGNVWMSDGSGRGGWADTTTWDMNSTDDVTIASVGATVQAYNADTSLLGQSISESELDISNSVSNGYVLQTDGSGVLSWVDLGLSASNYWLQTGEQIYAKNALAIDLLIGGDSTAAATIALQANTGNIKATSLNLGTGNLSLTGTTLGISTDTDLLSLADNNLTVNGSASMSGSLTIGQGQTLKSAYGPLSLAYKSAADTWTTGITLQDTTGNVGVGTTNPGTILDIYSANPTINLNNSSAADAAMIKFQKQGANRWALGAGIITGANHEFGLYDYAGSTPFLINSANDFNFNSGDVYFQNSTGNVGIGTTTPTAKIDVVGDASASGSLVLRDTSLNTIDSLNGGRLAFNTSVGGDAGLTEHMTILNNGNVGIGTQSPSSLLDITDVDANPTLSITNASDTEYDPVIKFRTGATPTTRWTMGVDDSNWNGFAIEWSNSIGSSTPAFFINSSSNVGLGKSSPGYKLDVAGDINISSGQAYRINGTDVSQYFITSAGTAGQVWTSDGSGVGGWGDLDTNTAFSTWDMNNTDDVTIASVGATVQAYNADTSILGQTIEESELNITNGVTNGFILQTDGSGNLTWVDPNLAAAATNYWLQTNEQLYAKNALAMDLLIGGDSTAAATIALQANTGNIKAISLNLGTGNLSLSGTTIGLSTDTDLLSLAANNLTINGSASMSGSLTIGDGQTIKSAYGPLSLAYKSAADAWTTGLTIQDGTGYVGVGNTNPGSKIDIKQTSEANYVNLLQVRNSAGTVNFGVNNAGEARGVSYGIGNTLLNSTLLRFALDTGISRGAAGKTYVGNGAGGDYSGTLVAGNIGIGTTSPTSPLVIRDSSIDVFSVNNQGSISYAFGGSSLGTSGLTMAQNAPYIGGAATTNSVTVFGGAKTTSQLILKSTSAVGTNGADILFQVGDNGATEAMRILNSGNIGIGINNPGYKLQVAGDIDSSTGTYRLAGADVGQYFITSAGNNGQVWTSDGSGVGGWSAIPSGTNYFQLTGEQLAPSNLAYDILLGDTATATATIALQANTGNIKATSLNLGTGNLSLTGTTLGISTDTDLLSLAANNLTVNGSASMSGSLTIGQGQTLKSAYGPLSLAYKSAADTWTTGITLQDTTGNVGIGTTAPQSPLHVARSTIGTTLYVANEGYNLGGPSALVVYDGLYTFGFGWDSTNHSAGMEMDNNGLHITVNGSIDKNIILQPLGNVGINDTLPGSDLSVVGNAQIGYATGTIAPVNGLVVSGTTGIGTTGPDRKLDVLDAANPQLRLTQADGTVYADFQVDTNGDLIMGVDGSTNQLVLDNSGSVGIGNAAPGYKLDVTGDINISTGQAYRINGSDVSQYFITTAGNNGEVWTSDGSGVGGWAAASSGGPSYLQLTAEQLAPSNLAYDILLGNTATATATIALQASTGNIKATSLNLGTGNLSLAGTTIGLSTDTDLLSLAANNLTVNGSASMSGSLTIGQGQTLKSAYGPLSLAYKSAADAWTTGLTLQDGTGYVGLNGVTNPNSYLQLKDISDKTGITLGVNGGSNSSGTGINFINPLNGGTNIKFSNTISGTNGTGISFYRIESGSYGISFGPGAAGYTNGTGIYMDTDGSTGKMIDISGSDSGFIESTTNNLVQIQPTKTTTAGGPYNDTANYLKVARNNTVNGAGVSLTHSGNLVDFSSNCTQTDGTCTDTAKVLSISQLYSAASGTVLDLTNAGSGASLRINDDGTFTDSTPFIITASGDVGIGNTTPGYKLDVTGDINISSGQAYRINGADVSQYFITSAGNNGEVWTSDGSGVGGWAAIPSGTNYFQLAAEQLAPSNLAYDILLGNTATATATIALQANTGNIKATSLNLGTGNLSLTGTTIGLSTDTDLLSLTSGALTVNGSLTVAGNILPSADDTYDLGSNTARFKDIYLGGNTLHMGTSTTDEGTISYDTATNVFNFSTDATTNGDIAFFGDDLYIDKSTGRVGIGTTNPSSAFEVAGASSNISNSSGDLSITSASTVTLNAAGGNAAGEDVIITAHNLTLAATGALSITPDAALTTAIDLTDTDLTNALSIGDNNIIGTTATIDFTNFDVSSTGVITNATWNGVSIGSQYGGSGANNSTAAQYSIPYFSATGVLGGVLAPDSAGYVLSTNSTGSAPSWISASGVGTNYWLQTGEQLYAKNALAMDVLVGGTSTAAATIALQANTGNIKATSLNLGTGNLSLTGTTLGLSTDTDLLSLASGALTVNGSLTTVGNILPSADNTYDLGSNTARFKDLYLGGTTLHLGTSTTDEATFGYNTTNNILNIGTDSTTNGDIAFFTDDLYLDKSTGRVGVGTTNPGASLSVAGTTLLTAGAASDVPLVVTAASGQTANLFEIRDSTAGLNASINSSGQINLTTPPAAPSYTNDEGQGNRTSAITVTVNLTFGGGSNAGLVDGVYSNDYYLNGGQAVAGKYIKFDFGTGVRKNITESKVYYGNTTAQGTWLWQGSDNNSDWTNIGNAFTLAGTASPQTHTELSTNTNFYRYYRLFGSSGTTTGSWYQEFTFKITEEIPNSSSTIAGGKMSIGTPLGTNLLDVGTNYLSVTSTGVVGLGTAGPDRKLDVLDATNPQLRLTQADGTVYADFQMNSNGDLVMNVDGVTNQLVLDNGGNIGIGNAAPTSLFSVGSSSQFQVNSSGIIAAIDGVAHTIDDVSGNLTLTSNSSTVSIADDLTIAGSASMSGSLTIGQGQTLKSAYGPLSLAYKSAADTWTTGLTLQDGTGNVGIGTTMPINPLSVSNASLIQGMFSGYSPLGGGASYNGAIALGDNNSYRGIMQYSASGNTVLSIDNTYDSDSSGIQFRMRTAGTPVTAMTILGSGNVGIGDTSPAAALTVGSGDLFQVNSSGIIANIDGVAHAIDDVSGNLTLTSNSSVVYINDGLTVAGNILPSADNTYDLGSNTARFKDLYLGGTTLHLGTSTTDEATFSYDTTNNILNIGTDSTTNGDIAFNTDDLYIDKSTGWVGFGTTNPGGNLEVGGATSNISNTTGDLTIAPASDLIITSNVGIGATNPAVNLHVYNAADATIFELEDSDGICTANPESGSVTWSCSSDSRLKSNIIDAAPVLNDLVEISIRDYTVNASGDLITGAIAQEIQQIMPELVTQGEDGYLRVAEISSWKLIKAIQELNTKITSLFTNFATQNLATDQLTVSGKSINSLVADEVNQQLAAYQPTTITVVSDTSTISAQIAVLEPRISTLEPQIAGITDEVATISARVSFLESRPTPTPEPLVVDDSRLTALESRVASLSAYLAPTDLSLELPLTASDSTLIDTITATDSAILNIANDLNLDVESIFISDFLSVLGDTILTTATVTNSLTVSTISSATGNLSLMGNLLTLDALGNAVTINGNLNVTGIASINELTTLSATVSGTLSAPIIDELSSRSTSLEQLVASLSAQVASLSAQLASPSATPATASTAIEPPPSTRITVLGL